jgi:hypothetical protein
MHWGLVAILFFRNFSPLSIQAAREELSRLLPGGRLKMEDGKTAKACSRFGHERSEVARRAEGAGGAPESTWEMVSHEGTKTRRRGDGEEF